MTFKEGVCGKLSDLLPKCFLIPTRVQPTSVKVESFYKEIKMSNSFAGHRSWDCKTNLSILIKKIVNRG